MKFFAKENSVSVKDLEEALLQWRLKSSKTSEPSFNNSAQSGVYLMGHLFVGIIPLWLV